MSELKCTVEISEKKNKLIRECLFIDLKMHSECNFISAIKMLYSHQCYWTEHVININRISLVLHLPKDVYSLHFCFDDTFIDMKTFREKLE